MEDILWECFNVGIFGLSLLLITESIGFFLSKDSTKVKISSQLSVIRDTVKSFSISVPAIAIFQTLSLRKGMSLVYYNYDEYGYIYLILSPFIWLFFMDTISYWVHRWFHSNKILYKYVHSQHHSYHPVTSYTTSGVSWIENFIFGVLPFHTLFFIIPFHVFIFYFFSIYQFIWFVLIHGDYDIETPRMIMCPKDHLNHHKYVVVNYGTYSLMWDYICGTLRVRGK
jgi:lathosterol oxidase